jgi:hypothetical protein
MQKWRFPKQSFPTQRFRRFYVPEAVEMSLSPAAKSTKQRSSFVAARRGQRSFIYILAYSDMVWNLVSRFETALFAY